MRWFQHSKRQILQFARRAVNLIYPPQCACCREEFGDTERIFDLCDDCQERLIPKVWTSCPRCGGVVVSQPTRLSDCAYCRDTQFHFDTVVALGSYHTELKHVVLKMKKRSGAALALAMGKQLGLQRREMLGELPFDLIIPIPMYWSNRILRGVNNPELVACELGRTLGLPTRRWLLVRCKKTLTQSTLPPQQRFRNVRGAFRVRFAGKIRGRRILLVDDVLTTGATCSEAARVLKQAGAAIVAVAVVARAQGEST